MTEFDNRLSDSERETALSDLRDSLRLELGDSESASQSLESTLLHHLTLHENKDKYIEVYEKLFPVITLPQDVFTSDIYSPTPGDPMRSTLADTMYSEEAVLYMFEKVNVAKSILDKKAIYGQSSTLSADELNTARREISLQHDREVEKNSAAFDRLRAKFVNDPSSISPEEAEHIEKVRGLDASTAERIGLLALHPEIDAIEDMKFTCFMDYSAYSDALSDYRARLYGLNNDNRFVVALVPTDEQSPRPRDIASDDVRADKTVIAEIFDTKTSMVFEAVEKTAWFLSDSSRSFSPFVPHVVEGVNELPIYTQVYLRLKRNRLNDDELREQQRQYDARQMFIRRGGIQEHIEDL